MKYLIVVCGGPGHNTSERQHAGGGDNFVLDRIGSTVLHAWPMPRINSSNNNNSNNIRLLLAYHNNNNNNVKVAKWQTMCKMHKIYFNKYIQQQQQQQQWQ